MSDPRNGKIVTFYSYKGGTGRSMLLANVAWILASHRKRVLMVDWDLEAPGLHRYFHPFIGDKYLAATPGLTDWVLDYQTAVTALDSQAKEIPTELMERHADLTPYLISIDSSDLIKGTTGALHLLPAGRQDATYPGRFSDLDFRGLYRGLDGFRFFELVKEKMKAQYDYVLIDSRTGVGDTSSICTMQMPDVLVVCFTLNSQSTVGASSIARSAFTDRKAHAGGNQPDKQAPLIVLPVPTRIERSEKQKLERARRRAYKAFEGLPDGLEGRDLERYWRSVEVPYEAFYAYEEVLAVLADQPGDITSVLAAAERLTRYIAGPDYQELVRMPEERRQLALARYSESDQASVTIAERAERLYAGLSTDQESAARELFMSFVELSAEELPYARPVKRSALAGASVTSVGDLFLAEGILSSSQSSDNDVVYELSDPGLVKSWSRIADWIKQDLLFRRWHSEFRVVADAWHFTRNDALLVRGKAFLEGYEWRKKYPRRVSPQESEFLTASVQALGRGWFGRFIAALRGRTVAPWYRQAALYIVIAACGSAISLVEYLAHLKTTSQNASLLNNETRISELNTDNARNAAQAAALLAQTKILQAEIERKQAQAAQTPYIPPESYQELQAATETFNLEFDRYKAGTDSFFTTTIAHENLVTAGLAVAKTAKDRITVYKSAIEVMEKILDATKTRFNGGVASKTDVTEAQRHLSDLQAQLAKEQKLASAQ